MNPVQRFAPVLLGKRATPEKRQSLRDMFNLVFANQNE